MNENHYGMGFKVISLICNYEQIIVSLFGLCIIFKILKVISAF